MAAPKHDDDPYRVLGVLPGADLGQIKAAHRRMAKRFHPDRAGGDESRFVAVQEAYQLLADPQRRSEWDRLHAPGPVRASAGAGSRHRARRSESGAPSAPRRQASGRTARETPPPGRRSRTWSAEHVPWWHDFRPRQPGEMAGSAPEAATPADASDARAEATAGPEIIDFDVFSRSSGAAWSMAARRHFRRGDAELPSRGAWRYRGTQVVTGAEARKVAAEEAARTGRTEARSPEPRDRSAGSAAR